MEGKEMKRVNPLQPINSTQIEKWNPDIEITLPCYV